MRYSPIDPAVFIKNRSRLVKLIKSQSLVLLNSNDIMPTNSDGTMKFKQNSDLYYFTGIEQEESILVLCPDFPDKKYRTVLFLTEGNEMSEKWNGHKFSKEEARKITGIETIAWTSEFRTLFHQMMVIGGVENVYLNSNEHYRSDIIVESRDARFIKWCQSNYPLHQYERLAPLMSELRTDKSNIEIELLQKAIDITEKGFRRVLKWMKPGIWEYEVEAEFIHEFVRNGSRGFAYEPIIASGKNNVVLHYVFNDNQCKDKDLLLLDVAAEYANYNADMTRTIPVNGTFTPRQKQVYNAVLHVQREAFKMLKPGVLYFEYQKEVEKVIESELLKLKLLDKTDIKNQQPGNPAFRKYFYHGTSHQLGLDVHDLGNMHHKIQAGQVWTVEPGIYIKEEGLGVRLENNVLITKTSIRDLMKNIPIEADEIESLMHE